MVIRLSVSLRSKTFAGIQLGDDTYSDEALSQAEDLVEKFGDEICAEALVDRFGGLVLVFSEPNVTPWAGWHFQTAICGYNGAGPITSARILALFGFGAYGDIFERISHGGNDANFTFTK